MAIVKIEGQEIPLDDETARDDGRLKEALKMFFPEIVGARISRETREGQMIVTAVKQAGPKGAPLDALIAAPETLNPALAMYWSLKREEQVRGGGLSFTELLELQPEIDAAGRDGEHEVRLVARTVAALVTADPIPAPWAPEGF